MTGPGAGDRRARGDLFQASEAAIAAHLDGLEVQP
jgi:hypothetical protein